MEPNNSLDHEAALGTEQGEHRRHFAGDHLDVVDAGEVVASEEGDRGRFGGERGGSQASAAQAAE